MQIQATDGVTSVPESAEARVLATMEEAKTRTAVLPAFLLMLAVSAGVYFGLGYLQALWQDHTYIFDFGALMGGFAEGTILWRFYWFLADISEGFFIASIPATGAVLIGTLVGWQLEKRGSRLAGTGVDGNSAIFLPMLLSGLAGLIIAQTLYQPLTASGLFVPTFGTLFSVQAMIMVLGATDFKRAATVTVLAAATNTPVCFLILKYITMPAGLPLFMAVGLSIMLIVPVCMEIMYRLPWMKAPAAEETVETAEVKAAPAEETKPELGNLWFIHRIFGDVSEMVLWGSSWGVIAMYIACFVGTWLNPAHGGFNAANVISIQILTAALGIFIWYPKWQKDGFAFTFPALLLVTAVAITYPFKAIILVPTIAIAVLGILPLHAWILKVTKFHGHFAMIVYVLSAVTSIGIPWCLIVANFLA